MSYFQCDKCGGVEDTAVWGGVMTEEAVYRNLGGAVVDGAVRDIADMRKSGFSEAQVLCKEIAQSTTRQIPDQGSLCASLIRRRGL